MNGKVPTLRTGRHGILYVKNGKLNKITGYESLLLQGFPKNIAQKAKNSDITNTKLLSQAGNAMTVNVISAIGKELLNSMGVVINKDERINFKRLRNSKKWF
jgi:DNA (cytosine-5)-methyltransferase 1